MRKYAGILAVSVALFALPAFFVQASIAGEERGANITPSWSGDMDTAEFKQSIQDLKDAHANAVSFVIPISQANIYASDIYSNGQTPSDEAIGRAIDYAHGLGLMVTIKPHLDPQDGQWRANIDASDRARWFSSYGAVIKRYAALAEAHDAERFIIGTELIKMASDSYNSANTAGWRQIISDVRAAYSGEVTYAANWGPTGSNLDEKNQIAFWDALDYIGLDAYYRLSSDYNDYSVETFRATWSQVDINDVAKLQARVGKPVVFTEIGYKSTGGGHLDPGDYWVNNGVNQDLQANAYEAFFGHWDKSPYYGGVYLWEWTARPNPSGQDVNYTPQNKKAEEVLIRWFSGQGSSTPVSTAPRALAATAQNQIVSSVEAPVTVTAAVSNTGRPEQHLLIDIEVYDKSGNRVLQKFYEGQVLAVGETKNFTGQFAPAAPGVYTVRLGIFGPGWSPNYVWNHTAATITVGSGSSQPQEPASFSASATAPAQVQVGQPMSFTATAKATGGATNALVDVEVYDSNNQKKFQKIFSGEQFAAGQTKNFTINWTPGITDTYRVTSAVFTNDWSKLYRWNNQAATFQVINGQPQNPPATTTPNNPPATTTPPVNPPATTTPPTNPPPPAGTSPLRNGTPTLVSSNFPQTVSAGQGGTVTAVLKSQNGENANNVSVRVQLLKSGVVAAENKASTDLLHDSQKTFSLSIPSSLAAGSYTVQVTVYNNADNLINKQFQNVGTITVQ